MTQIVILFYVLIIFLILFPVETIRTQISCVSDDDCPKVPYPLYIKCEDNFCDIWASPY
ncbi:Nodule Cysteine-Rich (NCR) secreted peptide [Medicago truncatula]|uniref:Nodule Cysteine-Rich (NCR) secreted peptide n=1 Tax=Medicago truncatula TaxID=3880 RepID=G7IDP6_MEDTR|nr:Nodule Cysteine-Rich (NCR) secreted peptide [Medicago truncatula]